MKPTNHDILVKILLRRIGPLRKLKKDALEATGRKYVTRSTIRRAIETAEQYLLNNELFSPAMDDWKQEDSNVQVQEGDKPQSEYNPTEGEVPSTTVDGRGEDC